MILYILGFFMNYRISIINFPLVPVLNELLITLLIYLNNYYNIKIIKFINYFH